MEQQCSAEVYDRDSRWSNPCSRKAKVERDGKWYCKIHDPEYIKAKGTAWNEKLDKEFAERDQRFAQQEAKRREDERKLAAFPVLVSLLEEYRLIVGNTGWSIDRDAAKRLWEESSDVLAVAKGE